MKPTLKFILALLWLLAQQSSAPCADEPLFSGPQVGESLTPFVVRGVFDDNAGKEIDFVTAADGKPIVLIFVHDVNRPSIAMTRVLSQYTASRAGDGLATGVVWLNDDLTDAENELKRIRHALAPQARTGISIDGREGPGLYGLNRNVTLTILVGKEGKVTANYALVQPSLAADLPKILASVVEVAGGEVPKLDELEGMREMMAGRAAADAAPNLRPILAPLIRQQASDEEVDQAAEVVEKRLKEDEAVRKELGRIASTIVESGKLENYGTAHAQEYLRKWAKAYGSPDKRGEPKTTATGEGTRE